MPYDFQLQRGLAARWASVNPTLKSGEPGVEIDTGQMKVGDGTTKWNDLPYVGVGSGGADPRIGDLSTLTTTEKSTVVGSINEVNTPPVALTLLYDNAKA